MDAFVYSLVQKKITSLPNMLLDTVRRPDTSKFNPNIKWIQLLECNGFNQYCRIMIQVELSPWRVDGMHVVGTGD